MSYASNKQFLFSFALLFAYKSAYAQPYIDIGKLIYYYSPAADKSSAISSQLYSINVTLPIELKKDGDVILLNPFFDNNKAEYGSTDVVVSSTGMMMGFIKKDVAARWDLMTGVIIRRNQQNNKDIDNGWQAGGIALATFKKHEWRSFKFGFYYNREFFGNFFMPLVGIDWKINERTNLFGVLPGSMVLERKVKDGIYFGVAFRALTNSYRLNNADSCLNGDCSIKNYLRINDNQLGLFGDIYFLKRVVFSTEIGHTIMRTYRHGSKGDNMHAKTDLDNDNWYVKGTLAYRLRFAGRR